MVHTHVMFSAKQRSAWAQWRCVWTKPSFVRTQLCFVQTVCVRREAEICARTFWLREDEAELCPIEHFRKNTALLRPVHMTAAFSSLRVVSLRNSKPGSEFTFQFVYMNLSGRPEFCPFSKFITFQKL